MLRSSKSLSSPLFNKLTLLLKQIQHLFSVLFFLRLIPLIFKQKLCTLMQVQNRHLRYAAARYRINRMIFMKFPILISRCFSISDSNIFEIELSPLSIQPPSFYVDCCDLFDCRRSINAYLPFWCVISSLLDAKPLRAVSGACCVSCSTVFFVRSFLDILNF